VDLPSSKHSPTQNSYKFIFIWLLSKSTVYAEEYRDDFAIMKPTVGHTELVHANVSTVQSL
jgi:hypothetical protein